MRIDSLCLRLAAAAILGLAAGCAGTPETAAAPDVSPQVPVPAAAPVAAPTPLPCRQPPIAFSISAAGDGEGEQGQGVADLLAAALSGSGCFVMRGTVAPPMPPLNLSGDSDAAAAMPGLQPDRPRLSIQTGIRSFQQPCKGGSLIVLANNQACIAVELHLSDAATGQLLRATVLKGDSAAPATTPLYTGAPLPAVLSAYAGTPMEQAIRNAVEQAAASIAYWYLTEQP